MFMLPTYLADPHAVLIISVWQAHSRVTHVILNAWSVEGRLHSLLELLRELRQQVMTTPTHGT